MAKPNTIHRNSSRKLVLAKEVIRDNYADSLVLQSELKLSGLYHMVKITRFKMGANPNKYNNYAPTPYHYAIRAYSKSK